MGVDPAPTPYATFPTPEVAAARDSLALLLAASLTVRERAACEWLHAYATEELARRLTGFVDHVDGQVFGVALEALAFDVGIVRGPPQHGTPSATIKAMTPTTGRLPVPIRGGGRRRG